MIFSVKLDRLLIDWQNPLGLCGHQTLQTLQYSLWCPTRLYHWPTPFHPLHLEHNRYCFTTWNPDTSLRWWYPAHIKLSTCDIGYAKTKPIASLRSSPGARQRVANWTPAKPNSYGSQEGPRTTMIFQCKLTSTAASNHQTWCEILIGVLLDNTLSLTNHISSVTKSCFFHLQFANKTLPQWKMPMHSCSSMTHIQIWLVQLYSDEPTRYLTSFIRLYPPQCGTTCQKLEVKGSYHLSSSARSWLPIEAQITFKIGVLVFNFHSVQVLK